MADTQPLKNSAVEEVSKGRVKEEQSGCADGLDQGRRLSAPRQILICRCKSRNSFRQDGSFDMLGALISAVLSSVGLRWTALVV